MRRQEEHMQTCTQDHKYFNDSPRTTPILSPSHSIKAQLIFVKVRLEKKIHQQSYFFTANRLKNSVDIIWLYSQRNSPPLQD